MENYLFGSDCPEKEIYIHLGLTMLRLAGDVIFTIPEQKRRPIRNKIVGDIPENP